ncbi:MAG: alpha/beta hydrolase [Amphiplicatus sp.]
MKFAASLLSAVFCFSAAAYAETITTQAADGVTVYGEAYYADLPTSTPMISLFHQAGSNGRGEYGPLTDWLNGLGYRVIAWDQRSGDGHFGGDNRTAAEASGPDSYCDAYPDVEAGVAYAYEMAQAVPLIIWGSSYSASLVWRAAAEHPHESDGVVAMSTATGGKLDKCGAKAGLPNLADPGLAVWPTKEGGQAKALSKLLTAKNVEVLIVEDGVHGSSTLVDERTGHDMSAARAQVAEWLENLVRTQEARP